MFPSQMNRQYLIAQLQRYRKEANANRNFGNAKDEGSGKPYFRNYPPEVQKVCWEHFSLLCSKHKAKLEANSSYVSVLVATATRLALDELGLRQVSRKGFHRLRIINRTKVALGIRDKNPNRRRPKNAAPTTNLQKCNVSQLSLEC